MSTTRAVMCLAFYSLLAATGCQQQPGHATAEVFVEKSGVINEIHRTGTVTVEEVKAFQLVIRGFPEHKAPTFTESALPRITSADHLGVAVADYRQAIREAVTPERQAQEWNKDPLLQAAFEKMRLNPVAFATLMLRISCAWSAWTIEQQASLQEARQQLNIQLAHIVDQLQNSRGNLTDREQQELLESLEEVVGLSEFIELLVQVPEESLQAMAATQTELRQIMPPSQMAREFAELVESKSAILRTGYTPTDRR